MQGSRVRPRSLLSGPTLHRNHRFLASQQHVVEDLEYHSKLTVRSGGYSTYIHRYLDKMWITICKLNGMGMLHTYITLGMRKVNALDIESTDRAGSMLAGFVPLSPSVSTPPATPPSNLDTAQTRSIVLKQQLLHQGTSLKTPV